MDVSTRGGGKPSKQKISMNSGDFESKAAQGAQQKDKWMKNAVCYWCGKKGHDKFNCLKFKTDKDRIIRTNGIRKYNFDQVADTGKKRKTKCGIYGNTGHVDLK